MAYKSFKVQIENNIATVFFNRPEKANSLDIPTWKEMKQVFDDLAVNEEARVIVLRGEGKHFCAGMDLQTLMSLPSHIMSDCPGRQRESLRKFILEIQAMITAIEDCRKPVIAAVQRACIGGGLNIISACDMRYCTDDAYFSIKEVDLGLVADIGAMQRMPFILNPGVMAELAYTGRQINGPEAARIGLVNESFEAYDAMLEKVMDIAKQIASKSPLVIRGTKEQLLYRRDHNTQDSLNYMATWNGAMLLSNDITEAMQANFEKREPKYIN